MPFYQQSVDALISVDWSIIARTYTHSKMALKVEGPALNEIQTAVREAVREEFQSRRASLPSSQLLTKEEVAERLNVSPRTVDTLAAAGELPKVQVRRCVRFTPGAVDAYIRRQAREGEG